MFGESGLGRGEERHDGTVRRLRSMAGRQSLGGSGGAHRVALIAIGSCCIRASSQGKTWRKSPGLGFWKRALEEDADMRRVVAAAAWLGLECIACRRARPRR